jgi:membrane protease YdiL (CAAX protease family)
LSFEQARGVYFGRPYLLLYSGFVVVLLLDLVLKQGQFDMLGQIEVTVLLVGIFGLFLGYMVNIRYIRTGRPTLKDRSNLLNFGVGMFIVTTLISSALAGWAQYTQSLQDMGAVIVLSAAPFEEALFRFAIASMLYSDPLVHTILFVNSFIYTMVFLYTSDIMTSTTAHLLHNAVALFL